jgi:predicted nucleotidyltransferase
MFKASYSGVVVADLERMLATHASEFTAKGVRTVSLVGSRARATARPDSDIDLLLDLAPRNQKYDQ